MYKDEQVPLAAPPRFCTVVMCSEADSVGLMLRMGLLRAGVIIRKTAPERTCAIISSVGWIRHFPRQLLHALLYLLHPCSRVPLPCGAPAEAGVQIGYPADLSNRWVLIMATLSPKLKRPHRKTVEPFQFWRRGSPPSFHPIKSNYV